MTEYKKLKNYIKQSDIRNVDEKYDASYVKGISTSKAFIDTKANLEGVSMKNYKIVMPGQFAYVPDTSRRGDKISLAYNNTLDPILVSSISCVFEVISESELLADFLFVYFNRTEFDRLARFNSWGTARETFSWDDLCDLEIPVPDLQTQKNCINAFYGMLNEISELDKSIELIVKMSTAYQDHLYKSCDRQVIARYIEEIDKRNIDDEYTIESVRGISTLKEFITTKANMNGVSVSNYKMVEPCCFAYVSDTSRRGDKISLAFNNSSETYIVSSITTTFQVKKECRNKILPEYLFMYLKQPEFDRYARYNSWGSARETITWDDFGKLSIPVPDVKVQKKMVSLFEVYDEMKKIKDEIQSIKDNICSVMISGIK